MNHGQIADNFYGGGIYNNSGTLTLNNVTFSGNVANPNLGPLANNGGLTLTHMPQPPSPSLTPSRMASTAAAPRSPPISAARHDRLTVSATIGAVEYGAQLLRLYLPLILR